MQNPASISSLFGKANGGQIKIRRLAATSSAEPKIEEHTIRLSVKGRFPPDLSQLLGLGFDMLSSSKNSVLVRKVEGRTLSGEPHLFAQLEIRKGSATLQYSVPPHSDRSIRRLHASLLLLSVLRLIPKLEADAQQLSEFLLPSLEAASAVAGAGYSALSKKFSDLKAERDSLAAKAARLQSSSEESALAVLELQRQLEAFSARVRELSAVSDAALCESVLEWLRSHRGSFDAAQFSSQAGVPLPRAEEGLEMLLKSGTISKVGAGFAARQQEARQFEVRQQEIPRQAQEALLSLLGRKGRA